MNTGGLQHLFDMHQAIKRLIQITSLVFLCFFCSIYKDDHNKWTGVPSSAGGHSWTGVHWATVAFNTVVVA